MAEFDFSSMAGVSFSELFGSEDGEISMARVEAFLDQVVEFASETAKISPNELVRVVHGGKVMWMTQQQAADFLEESSSRQEVRRDVERALKGELKYIRRELEVLLAVAMYTFKKCTEAQLISQESIERIEPGLRRRSNEISEVISQTSESEMVVENKRKRNPQLGEYEKLMGEFLNEKSKGNMQRATELAKELNLKKKTYVLLTRSIEPDVRTIYYHRLNLQKTKKRILGTQNELCSSRQESLKVELTELQMNMKKVQMKMQHAADEGHDTALGAMRKEQLYTEEKLKTKNTELSALAEESSIIEKQEQDVDAVISTISESVLQETDAKFNVQDALKKDAMKTMKKPAPKSAPAPKQRGSGMHVRRH